MSLASFIFPAFITRMILLRILATNDGVNESAGEVREARILNMIIRVTNECWGYEVGQRHADLIVQETGAIKMGSLTHPGGGKQVVIEEDCLKDW